MHAKVVLFMSLVLTAAGTVLLKLTEDITWMGAFFTSVSARTAGFSTFPLGSFSSAGLLTVIVLMVIGASPGSTGGGIKTTTCYVLFEGIRSSATNTSEKAFRYAVPADAFRKAAVITLLAIGIVLSGTYILVILEPGVPFLDALK
jgi:trk system potassium uptake protein TrkH